jgi:hypothetical protein
MNGTRIPYSRLRRSFIVTRGAHVDSPERARRRERLLSVEAELREARRGCRGELVHRASRTLRASERTCIDERSGRGDAPALGQAPQ